MKLFDMLKQVWDKFDRWLCRSLPGSVKIYWSKLWIRKDEFHPSLNSNAGYANTLGPEKRKKYFQDLEDRRKKSHQRDLAND